MSTADLEKIKDFLPLLIPLVIIELGLLAYTLWHINTHENYKHGTRALWNVVAIVGMQFIGPILYFIIGKEDE
ncbi:MAG: PLDc N-terminal domain-containing protein [Lachnospiraceae bacterium]|nr:PLDc N-terminal domain-containing protein [Lachnospiraceae bacterium]MBO4696060.1 PLDc N-terminal domain-containing protein [Lachnospiraceae bacterium]